MEKTKKITAQEAFNRVKQNEDKRNDREAFNEFQNELRQGLTSEWTQKYGSTSVNYWPGYAHDLERMLFDELKPKTAGSGRTAG